MTIFNTKERDDLVGDLEEMEDALEKLEYLVDEVTEYFSKDAPNTKEYKRAGVFARIMVDEIGHMKSVIPSTDWAKNLQPSE